MANISTENINTLAQLAASVSDGDYIYIYKASSNSFARIEKSVFMAGIEAGLSPDDIINNLNSTATDKALAAAQGNVLKSKINEVYSALQSVYAALGASAFWGEKTPVSTMLPDLDWASTKYTVSVSNSNSALLIKRNGTPIGSSFQVDEGTSVTLSFEGAPNYNLESVSVNGTNLTISNNSATYTFIVNSNMTLTVTSATEAIPNPITVNKTLNGCSVSSETTNPYIGGAYSVTIAPPAGGSITNVSATMAGGGSLSVTDAQDGAKTISTLNVTGDITIVVTAESVMQEGVVYKESTHDGIPISDGGIGAQSNTHYIDISGYTRLLYIFGSKNVTPGQFGVAFYDENKQFIGFMNANSRNGYRNETVDGTPVPTNAKYARCSFWTTSEWAIADNNPYSTNNPSSFKKGTAPYYKAGLYGKKDGDTKWTRLFNAQPWVDVVDSDPNDYIDEDNYVVDA